MEGTIATDVTTNDYGENGTFVRVYKLTKWWRDELNKRIFYRKSKLHDQSTSALINNIFPHKLFFVWMNENFCWHIWTSFNLLQCRHLFSTQIELFNVSLATKSHSSLSQKIHKNWWKKSLKRTFKAVWSDSIPFFYILLIDAFV